MNRAFLILAIATTACMANERPVASHPQRELILKNLQLLVDDTAPEETNHFFACRIDNRDWFFWREGRLLMPTTFEPAVGDREISAEDIWGLRIRYCRKPIELDSGVVPTRADLPPGTTFHVTRDLVTGIVYDCVLNGEMVVVKKTPNQPPQRNAGSRPSSDDSPESETPSSRGPRG